MLVDDANLELTVWYLTGKDLIPEVGPELWLVLGCHEFGGSFSRPHGHAGKPLQQWDRSKPVITVPMGDIDLSQFSSRRRDPVADLGGLCFRHRRIDEYGVALSHDEGRRDRRPHPRAAVGQRPTPGLRYLIRHRCLVLRRNWLSPFRVRGFV